MNINVKYQGKETSSKKYGCNILFSNIECDGTTTCIVEYMNSECALHHECDHIWGSQNVLRSQKYSPVLSSKRFMILAYAYKELFKLFGPVSLSCWTNLGNFWPMLEKIIICPLLFLYIYLFWSLLLTLFC